MKMTLGAEQYEHVRENTRPSTGFSPSNKLIDCIISALPEPKIAPVSDEEINTACRRYLATMPIGVQQISRIGMVAALEGIVSDRNAPPPMRDRLITMALDHGTPSKAAHELADKILDALKECHEAAKRR